MKNIIKILCVVVGVTGIFTVQARISYLNPPVSASVFPAKTQKYQVETIIYDLEWLQQLDADDLLAYDAKYNLQSEEGIIEYLAIDSATWEKLQDNPQIMDEYAAVKQDLAIIQAKGWVKNFSKIDYKGF